MQASGGQVALWPYGRTFLGHGQVLLPREEVVEYVRKDEVRDDVGAEGAGDGGEVQPKDVIDVHQLVLKGGDGAVHLTPLLITIRRREHVAQELGGLILQELRHLFEEGVLILCLGDVGLQPRVSHAVDIEHDGQRRGPQHVLYRHVVPSDASIPAS